MKNKLFIAFAAAVLAAFAQNAFGGKVENWELTNGIKVIFNKTDGVKAAAIKIFTPVSAISENKNNAGISFLTLKLIAQSTKKRSSEVLANDIENIGADLFSTADYDFSICSIQCLADYFDKASEILSDVVSNPSFNEKEMSFEKQNILASLKSRKDSIGITASDEFLKLFYDGYSYANPILGTKESVSNISVKDLIDWHKYSYNAQNILISVSGNIDAKIVKKVLEEYFRQIPSGEKFKPPVFDVKIEKSEKKELKGKFNQAYIYIGFPAPKMLDDDFVSLKVANYILGGKMTSRLFVELREKLGLAYEVNAVYPTRKCDSFFAVYIGLDKKNIDLTLKKIDEILKNFCSAEISDQELKDTKTYIKGLYIMDRQTIDRQALYYGWREIMGQGYKYDAQYLKDVEKVSGGDILIAANRVFNSKFIAVIVKPDEK
jgi:predicted Zn-dependent peptidase